MRFGDSVSFQGFEHVNIAGVQVFLHLESGSVVEPTEDSHTKIQGKVFPTLLTGIFSLHCHPMYAIKDEQKAFSGQCSSPVKSSVLKSFPTCFQLIGFGIPNCGPSNGNQRRPTALTGSF